jgi:hypothetical protein
VSVEAVAATEPTTLVAMEDAASSSNRLQEIGRKARERLRQEQSQRRVIQRLDAAVLDAATKRSSAWMDAAVQKKLVQKTSKKRRVSTSSPPKKYDDSHDDEITDRWMPDVSHLGHTASTDTVQLHGLPNESTTARQIRKFFAGLDLYQIHVLLPYPVPIVELDARTPADRSATPVVERHAAHAVRAFVQFTSSAIAALAVQRSGELLDRTAIAVTPVPPAVAAYLPSRLAVEVVPSNATIEEILAKVVVDPVVNEVLWQDVMEELQFHSHNDESLKTDGLEPRLFNLQERKRLFGIKTHKSEAELAQLQQQMQWIEKERDRLLLQCPAAGFDDPSWAAEDAVLRLTQQCLQVLDTWMERAQTAWTIATRWKWLSQSSVLTTKPVSLQEEAS